MVEGESSLTAHSVFANNLLQKVASTDSRPEVRERIDALRNMVESMEKQPAAREMAYPHAKPVRPVTLEGCDVPPIEKTLQLLKLTKAQPQIGAAWILDLFQIDHFPETCLALYMAEEYNPVHFIIVNAGLHFLYRGYAYYFPDKTEEYLALARLCGVNIETALSSLPLHLPANDDVVEALLLGAFYTIELGKPSLAWILSSKASEMCQSLGYHRADTHANNDSSAGARRKRLLFWVVYTLDKSLSLRLGRSSTIQDYDVTVPEPRDEETQHSASLSFFNLWITESRIQGQIYELLYCPEALRQPEAVRKSRAKLLLGRLDELDTLTQKMLDKWHGLLRSVSPRELAEFFVISDHVLRLSIRTLIHRAVPNPPGSPTTFTAECIQTARETLARHQECMAVLEKTTAGLFSTYMNWTILFAPFVPFIVVFCQVIETRDRADLARLEAFVSSLQPYTAVSEAVDRLRRLFQVLYSVASQFVESQTGQGRDGQQPSTVDTCLAALGFPSQLGPSSQESEYETGTASFASDPAFQRGVNPMIWMGNGTELEDWFYNNQYMMGFMEGAVTEEAN
ncbi:fungal-specific transcription factor-like protein [Thermothelomyces thermophilus ATCC 42464]|uniref:Fungal-specific transcription factor-like protein n=1 Tax=Thermothelomyces thermophilus (strain ATCC 42464 / BCRC 31852 / DSM 1799) TaxID=573729 RepID=G2QBS9_THET4|nr:fungal-specific transcription factor-like protein [Thermothelomyces thermophilus ATCC 42464]AEO57210.1 fungal-specific transcription factor-like protein [Thermothelomyces thermophilus ATCC 42464]